MDSFWNWVTSGWGDAAAQWQDPFGSVVNSVGSVIGLPSLGTSSDPTQPPTYDGDLPSSPTTTSSGSWTPWAVGIGVLVALFLIILLLHELEEF